MTKQRKPPPWPFGLNHPTARARVVANYLYSVLREVAPDKAAEALRFFGQFGEDTYLAPRWLAATEGTPMTSAQVAELAQCAIRTVQSWHERGLLGPDGRRIYLHPGPGGYDPDDVIAFLQIRTTTSEQPSTPG